MKRPVFIFLAKSLRTIYQNLKSKVPKIEIGTRGCLESKMLSRKIEIGKIDALIRIEATQTK